MPGGELLGELGHALRDELADLDRVGAGQLIDRHDSGRCTVVARGQVVGLRAELDARDVAQVKNGAVGVGADDDVAELLRRDEAALRANRVGELLPVGHRLPADLAGGVHVVLRLETALMTSVAVTPSLRQLVGLTQTRIAYWPPKI